MHITYTDAQNKHLHLFLSDGIQSDVYCQCMYALSNAKSRRAYPD